MVSIQQNRRCEECGKTFIAVTACYCQECRFTVHVEIGNKAKGKVEPDYVPKYLYWSDAAIECYQSGAYCETCPVGWLQKSSGCKMPQAVEVLLETQGPPKGTLSIRPERFQMRGKK